MNVHVYIQNGQTVYEPVVEGAAREMFLHGHSGRKTED